MNQLDRQPAFQQSSFAYGQGFASTPFPSQQNQQHFIDNQTSRQQQQQQQQQQQSRDAMLHGSPAQPTASYPSTPISQSRSANVTPAPIPQQYAVRHSASPHQPNSPFSNTQQQHQPGVSQSPHPQIQANQRYPMAAPPLPQTPVNIQSLATNKAATPPGTQVSASQVQEQARIKLLFELNVELFEEVSNLQALGKGGATNAQHQQQLRNSGMDDKMATDEYIQTMRRVQANLAYLAPRGHLVPNASKMTPAPAHMSPPPHMPQLQPKYDRLKEMFPGWSGLEQSAQAPNASPRTNMTGPMNGMNT